MANAFEQFDEPAKANPFAQFDETTPAAPKNTIDLSDYTIFGAVENLAKGTGNQMLGGAKDLKDLLMLHGDTNIKPGTAPEDAYLQGYSQSPGGKAMGASRMFPAIAAGSYLFNKAEPVIEAGAEKLGINPKHVQAAETFLPALGAKLGKEDVLTPAAKAAASAIKTAGKTIAHPIDTAAPFAQMAVRHAMDIDKFYGGRLKKSMESPTAKAAASAIKTAGKTIAHPIDTAAPFAQMAVRHAMYTDKFYGGGLKKSMESPTAKEGERVGKKLNVNFSAGELTGNPRARAYEDAYANSAKYAEKFAEANEKKTNSIVGNFKTTLDKIWPDATSRYGVGDKLSSAYKKTIDSLTQARREQGNFDFEMAEKVSGGKPVISPSNAIAELKSYIKEGDSALATPAQKEASAQAKTILSNLKAKPPPASGQVWYDSQGNVVKQPVPQEAYKNITVRDLQNGLQSFGDGAKSTGGIWKNLATASDRRFSQAMKRALEKDLDATADTTAGQGAAALKIARDNYKKSSAELEDIKNTALGKIVGNAKKNAKGELQITPETMADTFTSMEPSQIKNTLDFLDKNHPQVAQMARRYTLERVLNKAVEGKGQIGEGLSKPFPKKEFVEGLPGDPTLDAIMGDPKAANDVRDVAQGLNRMIHYGAEKKGSQTTQRLDILHPDNPGVMQSLLKWGKGAIYRSIATDSLVDDLLNPQRRKELVDEAKKNANVNP